MPLKVILHKSMWRGAKIGAAVCGLVGFSAGLGVCIHYHLPVPPLFVTEIGILLGGCLGAMIGYANHFHLGRQLMRGILLGGLAGTVLAVVAPADLKALAFGALVGLGIFLGYQTGLVEPNTGSGWSTRAKPSCPS